MEIKQRDRILEAIDQLRRRKARPDSPRICNYMLRRFNVDAKETKDDLQRCVENEIVYKVEYKGDISYRNAAKWNNRHRSGEIVDNQLLANSEKKVSGSFSKIVSLSISELICQEPDFLELGVPGPALIKTIIAKSLVKYNKKHLTVLIQKEVENGGLVKLDNGNYSLGSNVIDTDKSDDDYTLDEDLNVYETSSSELQKKNQGRKKLKDDKSNQQLGFRVGGRKKLAKKVFDPSDNNLPKRKRGRPLGSFTKQVEKVRKSPSRPASVASNTSNSNSCTVCHQVRKQYERMITCRGCTNKVHLMCLQQTTNQQSIRSDYIWLCTQCKTCLICLNSIDDRHFMTCTACSNICHNDCFTSKDDIWKADQQWTCFNCQSSNDTETFDDKTRDDLSNGNTDSSIMSASPPALSPQNRLNDNSNCSSDFKIHTSNGGESVNGNDVDIQSNKSYECIDDSYDPNIPDASGWNSDDVYHYFNQYFPQEATIFKDQEIDGHSLLLMKRSDVLSSLNLKLGPALKIYRHVLKLQVRRDDIKLGWF